MTSLGFCPSAHWSEWAGWLWYFDFDALIFWIFGYFQISPILLFPTTTTPKTVVKPYPRSLAHVFLPLLRDTSSVLVQ